jgi:hypothetical protein
MKEFPDQETLGFLVGLRVANVVLQPYSIDIRFDDQTILVVEHLIEHVDENGNSQRMDIQEGFGTTALHKIVDKQVVSIVRVPFSLALHFDNEHTITVVSRPGPLESGHIWRDQDLFVF